MKLTPSQRHSAVWADLLQMFKDKRDILRAKNEGDHDLLVTTKLRAQIGLLNELIQLDQEELPLK